MKEHILAHTSAQHQADVAKLIDAFEKAKAEGAALVVKAKAANDTSAMDKAHVAGKAAIVALRIKDSDVAAVVQVIGRLVGAAEELPK